VERTSYKRGATDFSSQVAKMKSSGCDTVVMGTIIRETIGTLAESRKVGLNAEFVGTSASYTHLIHALGGPVANNYYATHTAAHPYADDASQKVSFWAKKYQTKFNTAPDVFSAYGYTIMDTVLAGISKAGKNLTVESFVKAMDSLKTEADIFGAEGLAFTPTNHLGANRSRLAQIQNGRWVSIGQYVSPDNK
jgi:branched-chain amino acid transport system substrate-binding protein